MMKVKLLISRAGPDIVNNRGDEIEVSNSEGRRLIDAGQAVLVRQLKSERATKKRPRAEKAVKG